MSISNIGRSSPKCEESNFLFLVLKHEILIQILKSKYISLEIKALTHKKIRFPLKVRVSLPRGFRGLQF